MNANSIIYTALRNLVVIPAGGTPSTNQYSDGLIFLNNMVNSWSATSSLIYENTLEELTIPALTQSFTMGATGDQVTAKPTKIKVASIKTGSYEYPLREADERTYAEFRNKSVHNRPNWYYFRETHPNSTMYFDVTTDQIYTLILTSMKELTEFPDGTTEISLPAYYEKAFIDNLTIELAPGSGAAKRVTPLMLKLAEDSKAAVIGKGVKVVPSRTELAPRRVRAAEVNRY